MGSELNWLTVNLILIAKENFSLLKSCKIQNQWLTGSLCKPGKKSANNLQVSKSSRDPPRDDPPPSLELEWAEKGVPRDGWEHYPLIETSYVYNSSGIKETFTVFLSTLAKTHGIRFARISCEVRTDVTFIKRNFMTLIRLKYTSWVHFHELDSVWWSTRIQCNNSYSKYGCSLVGNVEIFEYCTCILMAVS